MNDEVERIGKDALGTRAKNCSLHLCVSTGKNHDSLSHDGSATIRTELKITKICTTYGVRRSTLICAS